MILLQITVCRKADLPFLNILMNIDRKAEVLILLYSTHQELSEYTIIMAKCLLLKSRKIIFGPINPGARLAPRSVGQERLGTRLL